MKLQNMTVIFIIIMIPIIVVTSYYIGLQIKTITMQKDYTVKLQTAAKDSIQALEINTVEWNSSSSNLADSKRRDVLAAINTFTTSLANSMGIGGAGKGRIQTYIPAIAYTMYDGYYIYSASKVDTQETDGNGLTQFDDGNIIYKTGTEPSYQYILKPYSPYSARYVNGETDITVNYTLDNYIKIYGTVGTGDDSYVTKEGYLVVCDDDAVGINNVLNNLISGITYRGATITTEYLTEQIYIEGEEVKEYPYIYDQYDNKQYWDSDENNYFTVNANKQKVYLQTAVAEGDANFSISNTFRKISVPQKDSSGNWSVLKIFQILNPDGGYKFYYEDNRGAYVEFSTSDSNVGGVTVEKNKDFSAINYCVESYVFTKWVKENLKDIEVGNMQISVGKITKKLSDLSEEERLKYFGQYNNVDSSEKIFEISITNNPDPENDDAYATSVLAQHKKDVIINTLEKNLAQAQAQAQEMNPNYEYRLPQLTYDEWEQALSNISIIAYMQGMPIGLKYYNNYTIATSTLNKEYVDPDELYFAGTGDQYYHQRNCEQATGSDYVGYRSIDYVAKSYEEGDTTKYYYPHDKRDNTNAELECYYCLVNRSTYKDTGKGFWTNNPYSSWTDSYYNTLARERYMQLDDLEGNYIPETTDFVVKKTVDKSTTKYGETITYTITVNNNSSSDKASVVLEDIFNSNVSNFMTVDSITINETALNTSQYAVEDKNVKITIDNIAKAGTKTIKIIGKVIGNVGTYKNAAKITIDGETFSSSEITVNVIKDVKIVAKSLMPPTNIVFIIDASGSMVGTKINNVQKAVKSFVSKMPQDGKSMIGYVKFYSLPLVPIPLTQKKGPYKINEYIEFNTNLDKGIDGLILSWTTYYKGLEAGNDLLKEMKKNNDNKNNIAIFLSDGKPTESESYYKSQANNLKSTASEVYAIGYGNANFTELKNNVASDENHFFKSDDIETVFGKIFKNTIYNVNETINGESLVTTATQILGGDSTIGNWISLKNNSDCDFYINNENKMRGGIDINSTKIILKEGDEPKERKTDGLTLVEWSNRGYIGKHNNYLYLNLEKFSASGEITVEIVQ